MACSSVSVHAFLRRLQHDMGGTCHRSVPCAPHRLPRCATWLRPALQARMQRNRENAQLSRQRKKQQMEDLQVGLCCCCALRMEKPLSFLLPNGTAAFKPDAFVPYMECYCASQLCNPC